MPDFRLPDLGEGLTEAEIISWRVSVGDTVEVDQIVVEVETAKAAVEVPIPFAGVVNALHAKAGDSVAVGAPLITVAEVAAAGSGNVLIGYGTTEGGRTRRARPRRAGSNAPSQPVGVSSPLVRRQARDAGLDLAAIAGSGPSGLILRRDVEHALAAGPPIVRAGEQRIALTGVRKVIADKLSRSRREIPEATVWVDVDATELLATRAALNAQQPDRPVSLLGLVARFAVVALHRYPELNARIEGEEIVLCSAVNLGFAAQTDRGLVVPVVHDAQALSARELTAAISAHTAAARQGPLPLSDLSGGTFTINNYGVFGVDGSAAIINYPEVAILGLGRIIERPWVVDGTLAVRQLAQLTLAFDHRVCDGSTAGGFLRFVADCIEAPIVMLGDL